MYCTYKRPFSPGRQIATSSASTTFVRCYASQIERPAHLACLYPFHSIPLPEGGLGSLRGLVQLVWLFDEKDGVCVVELRWAVSQTAQYSRW
jgi:hypothetical protein